VEDSSRNKPNSIMSQTQRFISQLITFEIFVFLMCSMLEVLIYCTYKWVKSTAHPLTECQCPRTVLSAVANRMNPAGNRTQAFQSLA